MTERDDWRSRTPRRVVVDTRSDTVALVVSERDGVVRLQPLHGGQEWTAPDACVRPATPQEVARAL